MPMLQEKAVSALLMEFPPQDMVTPVYVSPTTKDNDEESKE